MWIVYVFPLIHIVTHVDCIRVSFNTHSNACGSYTCSLNTHINMWITIELNKIEGLMED